MARKLEVQLLDDIDGGKADETLKFGLDGTLYEVDLSAKHAEQLRKILAAYVLKARRVGRGGITASRGRGPRRAAAIPARSDREQNQAIREWAKSKGLEVSDRGRIPASVVEQYQAEAGR
jgi:Lsr2